MDEEQRLLGPPDPAWAKRIAKIEKKFVRAEQRQAGYSGRRPARRGTRAAYICGAVILFLLGFTAVARPFGQRPAVTGSTVVAINGGPDAGASGPFAGTPAATWSTADTGVVMPAATALGSISAAQVRAGLTQARRYIITARTAPAVLTDHHLQTLEKLLDPRQVAANRATVSGPLSYLSPTLLAPGFALAAPVRVIGTVTVSRVAPTAARPELHLVVQANLVWAYALIPHADTRRQAGSLAVLHEHLTLDVIPAARGASVLRVESKDRYESNVDCGYLAQGLLGLPRVNDPSVGPTTSGTVPTGTQIFDPRTSLTAGTNCRQA